MHILSKSQPVLMSRHCEIKTAKTNNKKHNIPQYVRICGVWYNYLIYLRDNGVHSDGNSELNQFLF